MRRALVFLAACSLVLGLVGCSADLASLHQASGIEEFATALQQVTVEDLDAATADAVAHNDVLAAACYPVLKKYVAQGLPGQAKVKGAFEAFQRARDGVNQFQAGVPTDLRMGCAPLLMDVQQMAMRIAAIAGAKSHGIPLP